MAVIELEAAPLGVVKPVGVAMARMAVPAATGWKSTLVRFVSGLIVTGLDTMVPIVVSELVTLTLTLMPVRMFWLLCAVSVAGFNWKLAMERLLFEENVVVEKLLLFHSIAEGVNVTVTLPLL